MIFRYFAYAADAAAAALFRCFFAPLLLFHGCHYFAAAAFAAIFRCLT